MIGEKFGAKLGKTRSTTSDVAIIGMAGRFPGADDVQAFWNVLVEGRETSTTFDESDLLRAGLPANLLKDPNYVAKRGVLRNIEGFDASFFSYSPREAEVLDPQQRVFLECAWTAMEDGGYDPQRCQDSVGVFAGTNMNSYLLFHLIHSDESLSQVHSLGISNEKDFLATRVSYKLNLRGPSMSVQCACSTSLVCVHLACQSLLAGECDLALAGGVSVVFPQAGYFYQPGGVFSPDGRCRPFDRSAAGTFGSDGAGVVLLKRLDDAVRDGDQIYAVILATSTNNDGSEKASFAAPSVDGQVRVLADAIGLAGIDAKSIGYVEAHGTGTPLGDPIEISALSKVFRAKGAKQGSCAVGSLKSNFGHLDQAAGVANLMKAALVLKHGVMPPTLNFEQPNPLLNLQDTPFRINSTLTPWPDSGLPRRASVSSFGFGGTNAHAILEGPPPTLERDGAPCWEILPLAARTDTALENCMERFAAHLDAEPRINLADAAYVLQTGRPHFTMRAFVVARSAKEAANVLHQGDEKQVVRGDGNSSAPPVYFMFPGQGSQFCSMGRELYASRPVFREHVDAACEMLKAHLGLDLRTILFPAPQELETAQALLTQTRFTQPALFVVEYALARLWMSCGVTPWGMIGHSIGEYVAACLSGVFSLADALKLVATRARLMNDLPPGSMLAVNASQAELRGMIGPKVSLAAVNGGKLSVLSLATEDVPGIAKDLERKGYTFQKLHTSHAFHSHLMEPMLEAFRLVLDSVPRSKPEIPFISNVTGTWILPDDAMSADYWCRHLRGTVMFATGLDTLLRTGRCTLLEVGPGKTLKTLARHASASSRDAVLLNSMTSAKAADSEEAVFLKALGCLWTRGAAIDWQALRNHEPRQRISLPTYPFERNHYFVLPRRLDSDNLKKPVKLARQPADKWVYLPTWSRVPLPSSSLSAPGPWLLLTDCEDIYKEVVRTSGNSSVFLAGSSSGYAECADGSFLVRPDNSLDLEYLLNRLSEMGQYPEKVVLAWSMSRAGGLPALDDRQARTLGVDSLFALAQALVRSDSKSQPIEVLVVTCCAQDVLGTEAIDPAGATVLGPCMVVPQEYPHVRCRALDWNCDSRETLAAQLVGELLSKGAEVPVAYRGTIRFQPTYQQVLLPERSGVDPISSENVVLIMGGFGEVGLTLAELFVSKYNVKVALAGRTLPPPTESWDKWIQEHGPHDKTGKAVARLRKLKNAGARIFFGTADVADPGQMRQLLADVRSSLGPPTYVVHAAGISGARVFEGVSRTTPNDLDLHFRAKVEGERCLEQVLEDEPGVKAVILQSSLFGALGGPGCAAACAATIFMDRAAARRQRLPGGPHWISIGWDAWLPNDATSPDPTGLAIPADQLLPVLESILALRDIGHVVVSTCSLDARRERWSDARGSEKEQPADQNGLTTYERPNLRTTFAAPESDIETMLAHLWQELLGVTEVGIHDDFFELGGHSLLAILIIGRIKDTFPVEVDFADVVDTPTISELAQVLEARLIEKLESMSEEDTSELLEGMLQPGSLQAIKEPSERYTLSN